MAIQRNECFRYGKPGATDFAPEQMLEVSDYIGKVRLPADYVAFMREANGVGGSGCDAFFLARFADGLSVFEFVNIASERAMLDANRVNTATSASVTKVSIPDGHIIIGECYSETEAEGFIIMCVDEGSDRYGQVSVAVVCADKWGEGDNVQGLGEVATSFTLFMNGFRPRFVL